MINLNREIRPEDFAIDPKRGFWESPEGDEEKRRYYAEREELKRLYELQEEAKAKARLKAEQDRKDQIPYSEALASEICRRVSAGFVTIICRDFHMPTVRSAIEWRKRHPDFAALYREAINDRLDIFEDEVVTIADDSSQDIKTVTKGNKTTKVLDGG